jgi:hypothetical protein
MNDKPYPIKLGELKPLLQKEAMQLDRSMAWLIRDILKKHFANKGKR